MALTAIAFIALAVSLLWGVTRKPAKADGQAHIQSAIDVGCYVMWRHGWRPDAGGVWRAPEPRP